MSQTSKNSVSCSNCKALCCRLEVQLIDDADEQVPKQYVQTDLLGREVMKRSEKGWCEALNPKTFLCEIYSLRPFLCREYEVASFDCLNERQKLPHFESKDDSLDVSE